MSRPHVTHLLTDFMEEQLAWQPSEKVKAHLAFCNLCRQALNELKRGITLLRTTPTVTPSSDLERRIMDWKSVESTHPADANWELPAWITRGFNRRKALIVTGAAIAGLLLFRLFSAIDFSTPERPPVHEEPAPKVSKPAKPVKAAALTAAAVKTAEGKARAETLPAPLEGSQSAISESVERVVVSESAWRELWIRHHANADRVPPLPQVDFSKSQVIALFAGERPTAGYRVQVVSVTEAPWNGEPARLVRYKVQSPPKNALTAQVLTQPFLFRVVSRFRGPTFFERNP